MDPQDRDTVTLIAAMNPCPCGYLGDLVHVCKCSEPAIRRYQRRISGPLLDRIDIHVDVPRIEYEKLSEERTSEPSHEIRRRIEMARAYQQDRFSQDQVGANSEMTLAHLRRYCKLDAPGKNLMKTAMNQLHLSARAYHRVLKLARSIADLAGNDSIALEHLAEALQYRSDITGLRPAIN